MSQPQKKWRYCPGCAFTKSVVEIERAKEDYLCPRCAEHHISEFQPEQPKPAGLFRWWDVVDSCTGIDLGQVMAITRAEAYTEAFKHYRGSLVVVPRN